MKKLLFTTFLVSTLSFAYDTGSNQAELTKQKPRKIQTQADRRKGLQEQRIKRKERSNYQFANYDIISASKSSFDDIKALGLETKKKLDAVPSYDLDTQILIHLEHMQSIKRMASLGDSNMKMFPGLLIKSLKPELVNKALKNNEITQGEKRRVLNKLKKLKRRAYSYAETSYLVSYILDPLFTSAELKVEGEVNNDIARELLGSLGIVVTGVLQSPLSLPFGMPLFADSAHISSTDREIFNILYDEVFEYQIENSPGVHQI